MFIYHILLLTGLIFPKVVILFFHECLQNLSHNSECTVLGDICISEFRELLVDKPQYTSTVFVII